MRRRKVEMLISFAAGVEPFTSPTKRVDVLLRTTASEPLHDGYAVRGLRLEERGDVPRRARRHAHLGLVREHRRSFCRPVHAQRGAAAPRGFALLDRRRERRENLS